MSKALLLYHFAGKGALLGALVGATGEGNAARLAVAARPAGAMAAWCALLRDPAQHRETAFLAALLGLAR